MRYIGHLSGGGVLVITTPNLAAWYNRIVLLFGFQPFMTNPSLRYANVGKLKSLGEGNGEHIRVFTYRALKDFLNAHDFTIVKSIGASHHNPEIFPFPLDILEKITSIFPSLSSNPVFVVKKMRRFKNQRSGL